MKRIYRMAPWLVILILSVFIYAPMTSASTQSYSTVEGINVKQFFPWFSFFKRSVVAFKVKNTTDDALTGPVRVTIDWKGWNVLAPDGFDENGRPYVWVSQDPGFALAPGDETDIQKVKFKRSRYRGFTFHHIQWRPRLSAQGRVQPLQLLHNADMDGATGALDNVVHFSAILEKFKNDPDLGPVTLILSSGDNYIPGPRYIAAADESLIALLGQAGNGRTDIAFLNAMGYQASGVGNHELDGGTEAFAGIIDTDGDYSGAFFPYLSTNLDFTADEFTAPLMQPDGLPAASLPNTLAGSATLEIAGQTVGIIGATTPKLASITSTGGIGIYPLDGDDITALAAEIQAAVDVLAAKNINKIILLAHMQQLAVERELATLLNDVDVIVAGGSNTLLADANDRLREGDAAADNYPLIYYSPQGEPVLVVNTDGDYEYLGRLVLAFDATGVIDPESLDSEVNGAYVADAQGAEGLSPNPEVVAITDALNAILLERDGNILGQTAVYLDGRRSQVRTQETNMGNLSAEANLWLAKQVDPDTAISIKNGGGIRDDIGYLTYPPGSTDLEDLEFFPPAANLTAGKSEGDISQFDIQGALRFNNGLTLLTVTAEELAAIVEHGVSATSPGATPGQFPQVAGLRFSFDPDLAAGARVRSLVVETDSGDDIVLSDGVLQGDAGRTFRLVTLNFLAGGGDDYPFPATERLDLMDSGLVPVDAGIRSSQPGRDADFAAPGSEQDALAEYLQEFHDPVIDALSMPYTEAENPVSSDERIQNLSEREDTVIP